MQKLHPKHTPLLVALIMSLMMGFLMSGLVTFFNTGLISGFISIWLHAFIKVWPIAFALLLVLRPVVMKIVAKLTINTDAV